jgi:type VI protein secretion system component VasF
MCRYKIVTSVCADIKKIKRRLYQQKRRQSQGKEPAGGGGTPKKQRIRKVSVSIAVPRYFIFLTDLFCLLLYLTFLSVVESVYSVVRTDCLYKADCV